MHVQVPVQGWLDGVIELPDGGTVKAVDNPSILREVKQLWAAAGRDPRQLITDFRFNDFQECPTGRTFAEKKAWYRGQFRRFIDGTFLKERYGDYIDLVEAENEFTATTTWTDHARTDHLLENIAAQLQVFRDEIRGKWVSVDGQRAFIPAHVRLVVCNGPVSNDIHRRILELSIEYDAAVGYHPYMRCLSWINEQGFRITRRYEFDWQDDSGRFDTMERETGLKPLWVFTECGPYIDVDGGWKDPRVLNADETLLVEFMGQWFAEVLACRAYNEGRILGWTGHWFTIGKTKWPFYELEAPQLVKLAQKARSLWRPPVPPAPLPPPEDEMPFTPEDAERLEAAAGKLQTASEQMLAGAQLIREVLDSKRWWNAWPQGVITPHRPLKNPKAQVTFYRRDGTAFNPQPLAGIVDWTMWVEARNGNLLKVYGKPEGEDNDWWVRAENVQPE